jgi:transcriptional regulator with XRE-family HTH domain
VGDTDTPVGTKRKFAQTRQLIKLATEDGLTQTEIAKGCRVTQSVVSEWANGRARATEQQMQKLLELYGHRLPQRAREVYLVEADAPEATDEREPAAQPAPARYVQVEGAIVWRHTFTFAEWNTRGRVATLSRMPVARWHLHREHTDRFRLVRLYRRKITPRDREAWEAELKGAAVRSPWMDEHAEYYRSSIDWLESGDDSARWSATIEPPMTAVQLVGEVEEYVRDENVLSVHDRRTLVFRLVRGLSGLGIALPFVERL